MQSKTFLELSDQYNALQKTWMQINAQSGAIRKFYQDADPDNIVVIGCGSGFHVSCAVAASAKLFTGICATAVAGGDLMLHTSEYRKLFEKRTLLVVLSRSGSTHEILYAIEQTKAQYENIKVLSFVCVDNSQLADISDCVVELPFAFDESVCQTRSVTNLYAAAQLAFAAIADCAELNTDIKTLADKGNGYLAYLTDDLDVIAKEPWKNAAVLCDGEGFGIAEEASLAFNEIAYTPSVCKHVLDVRHGPIVLIDRNTLVIARLTNEGFSYQEALIADLVKKGAYVIVVSDEELPMLPGVTAQFCFGKALHSAASALLLLPVAQLLSYFKALSLGLNPDQPDGLDPWIALK